MRDDNDSLSSGPLPNNNANPNSINNTNNNNNNNHRTSLDLSGDELRRHSEPVYLHQQKMACVVQFQDKNAAATIQTFK